MKYLDKIAGLFSKPKEADNLFPSFVKQHPDIPVEHIYAPFLRFSFLAQERLSVPQDISFLPQGNVKTIYAEAFDGALHPQTSLRHAAFLKSTALSEKKALLEFFLSLFSSREPISEGILLELKDFAAAADIPAECCEEMIAQDSRRREECRDLMTSGTGLLAALAVMLLFILGIMYVKTAFYGFLLAFLFLPLERFFERYIFGTKTCEKVESVLRFPFIPILKLKQLITRNRVIQKTENRERQKKNNLSAKASAATIVFLICLGFMLILTLIRYLAPMIVSVGGNLENWAKNNRILHVAEQHLEAAIAKAPLIQQSPGSPSQTITGNGTGKQPDASEEKPETAGQKSPVSPQAESVPAVTEVDLRKWIQGKFKEYLQSDPANITGKIFRGGGDILNVLATMAKHAGTFAFDMILTLFFFYVFLQKMAFYTNGPAAQEKASVGQWAVGSLLGSAWFPVTNERTRKEAAGILDHVVLMFSSWLRGYFWIIIIEFPLYVFLFTMFSVPYGIVLAMISCCTVLLPIIGLAVAILLTVCVTLAFSDGQTTFTLVGVAITYLSVNTCLEQFFLYPTLVGGAIGLTTVETIIVVLLGAMLGGIPGMIVAVPAAAVIKYLVPKIYLSLSASFRLRSGNVPKTEKTPLPKD